ncbi:MAG: SpoVR family protein [Chloroflexi bacterium]|nr:SpoVR family protein [Chloroflexota bacterium]OJW06513.1 MAG: stage V sporulation protein R [Chloroflexi bacterium 54-19]
MSYDFESGNVSGSGQDDRELRELGEAIEECWDIAKKFGLDPFPTHFEIVPANIMYEFGAYGIPGRFSHWTHGKAYYRMKTQYDYGLSKIYELVINSNPSYAFLMEANVLWQNKMIIAHVLGHTDFFKNNAYFGHTNRQIVESASLHADRIRHYEQEHGTDAVEKFLDAVLSIEEHINPNIRIKSQAPAPKEDEVKKPYESPYADLWELEDRKTAQEREKEREKEKAIRKKYPPQPEKDIVRFLMLNSRELDDWQRDIMEMVHNEAIYFLPQRQTKIMNEGWASLWHQRIVRELDLSDGEFAEYAQLSSGVLSPNRRSINPYYVGVKIWEDIERRWDNPSDYERTVLKRPGGQGKQKLMEVREMDNDVSFLRNYLTKELVEDLDLYLYEKKDNQWVIVEKDWEKVRDGLVASMTNFGDPYIMVEDADYKQNRELYLKHYFEKTPLDVGYAEKTLQYIYSIWGRTVHLETLVDNKKVLFSYDGRNNTKRAVN